MSSSPPPITTLPTCQPSGASATGTAVPDGKFNLRESDSLADLATTGAADVTFTRSTFCIRQTRTNGPLDDVVEGLCRHPAGARISRINTPHSAAQAPVLPMWRPCQAELRVQSSGRKIVFLNSELR